MKNGVELSIAFLILSYTYKAYKRYSCTNVGAIFGVSPKVKEYPTDQSFKSVWIPQSIPKSKK